MPLLADPGRVLILGAGPTGLGAAFRLQERGHSDFLVLEAGPRPGGLSASAIDEAGYTWDAGGHVQFSHYALYDDVLDRALGEHWLWHERHALVFHNGRLVPYPFQHHLHHLDPAEAETALAGLDRPGGAPPPGSTSHRSFADWIDAHFGPGLAALFMRPYNAKIWCHPLDRLSTSWLGDRVPPLDVADLRKAYAERRDARTWGPNHRFRYPLRGGTGAIWTAVACLIDPLRLRFRLPIVGVDLPARQVRTAGGETFRYDTLVSSMPLDSLALLSPHLSNGARAAAASLVANSVSVVGLGLRRDRPASLERATWLYFAAARSPYYRVTVLSNYSPHNAPAGGDHWSLLCEVAHPRGEVPDLEALARDVRDCAARDGLTGPRTEVVSVWTSFLERGYPVPTLDRESALGALLPELESHRVFSRGRFGAWRYEVSNQDHCFMQGVELADRLLDNAPEPTLGDPDRVNSGALARDRRRG